jgi:cell division protein ZapA (FtsZ GTPase activity inhibitor)
MAELVEFKKNPMTRELIEITISGKKYNVFVTHQNRKILEVETMIQGSNFKANDEFIKLILAVLMDGFHP